MPRAPLHAHEETGMYKRILLATDGSPTAETAERVGVAIARTTKGKLVVVHAYADPAGADAAVERALGLAEREGVKTQVVLTGEEPANAVLQAAENANADLIVIGSRGLFEEQQVFGSVVRKIATHAPCDVVLTRARPAETGSAEAPPYARLLVATDGSATADRAARKGFAFAKRLDAEVVLCFVGHPRTGELVLQDTVATMGHEEGVDAELVIVEGEPAERIMQSATDQHADLVVVGNRGLAGAKALLLGSIPLTVAEYARQDVLIARTIAQSLDEIGKGEGGIVTSADHKAAVYRDKRGTAHVLSAKCTHMGCTVKWNTSATTWDCPCHGSRFAPTGEVVNGPAAKPLAPTDL
jgi:nucleotide-binding universal stress UspA family protein/nitrite reductase/ring-hydroxylating ferredoxin subunit